MKLSEVAHKFQGTKVGDKHGNPRIVYHGGNRTDLTSTTRPVFFTYEKEDAGWFSTNNHSETRPGTMISAYVNIRHPADEGDVHDAAEQVGATTEDIQKYSHYDGENPADYLYVPEVVKELKRKGFDGYIDEGILENTFIYEIVPFDVKRQVEVVDIEPYSSNYD